MKRKLLIISCSKTKVKTNNPVPAIDLYNGPLYKLLRKYYPLENTDIWIISGKYGLIESHERIKYYDKIIDSETIQRVKEKIQKKLQNTKYEEIFICLGKKYRKCIEEISLNSKVIWCEGKIGQKLQKLKEWLIDSSNIQ